MDPRSAPHRALALLEHVTDASSFATRLRWLAARAPDYRSRVALLRVAHWVSDAGNDKLALAAVAALCSTQAHPELYVEPDAWTVWEALTHAVGRVREMVAARDPRSGILGA